MKTQIITLATSLVLALGTTGAASAATLNNSAAGYTILTDVSAISKIEVHGNVELYISDAPADQVKVYNKYYSESALVQSKNGVLCITSYAKNKLVVWVSAKDLRAISAFDNAEVKSFGDLSKLDFAADLHDNATASLKLDAINASLTVKDNAKAFISGSVDNFNLNRSITSNVNNRDLKTIHYTQVNNLPSASRVDDIAAL